MNNFASGAFALSSFMLPLLLSVPAHAGISACGDIDVEAHATCEVQVQDCNVSCTPLTVEGACAARLEGSCKGSCPQLPSVQCTGSCELDCEASCTVKPAEFDCSASCKLDATARCNAQCASSADRGECSASCRATFAAECDASCTGTPGSASCKSKCEGSCRGSCTAQSRLQCQVDCQATGYASCKVEVEGGCKADCSDPKGALFCNGEYIDHNNSVDECIEAIKAALPAVTVDASARGSSSCSGSTCRADGEAAASVNCAFSPRSTTNGVGALALFAALGAFSMRRRKPR